MRRASLRIRRGEGEALGFEYKIAFRAGDPAELSHFLDRLPGNVNRERPDYTVSLEPDGFYFCDFTKSDLSSRVFRRLVDKALNHSEVVIHEL
jgi:hypothetical protein